MASASRTPRRTAADWQRLIRQQRDSGLSAAAFCRRHELVYQTFVGRRRQLDAHGPLVADRAGSAAALPAAAAPPTLPGFVEIGLAAPEPVHDTHASDWLVELDLGDGMQLRVRRPR